VPEGRGLFTSMSVVENLVTGATPKRAHPRIQANLEKVFELFPRLKDRQNQIAGTLSGGEQQMLAIARGIMAEPVVFMIDELSLGIAPAMAIKLFEILVLLKQAGMTQLIVEQSVEMALAISDYAYVLSEGRTDLEGPSRDLTRNDRVRSAYLGLAQE
jgi:branched-chain amino acid transport system ATP-binding protein